MPTAVDVRVFTWPIAETDGHSYLVNNTQGGISPVLERIYVNDATTTFLNARDLIEIKRENMMTRRTALFQDILLAASRAENPHGWSMRVAKSSYRLGYYPKGALDLDAPAVVDLADEEKLTIAPFMRNNAVSNRSDVPSLIVVPVSQMGRCGRVCRGCTACTALRNDRQATVEYFLDGKVHIVSASEISDINIDRQLQGARDIAHALRRMGSSIEESNIA